MVDIYTNDVRGCMTHCCRCGLTIFRECTGEGEADGGFTRWNTFEPLPDGWEHHNDTGRLCPDCEHEYQRMMDHFMTPPPKVKEKE